MCRTEKESPPALMAYPKGEFIGMINLPSIPVSLCIGDGGIKKLYIVGDSKVYRSGLKWKGM
ncbi:MAG: hypothetical protein ABIS01_06820 [Ferruginibacter sp.]